ncbi:MAG: hypothetical protein J1G02_00970 [Clostridiales bacterium]|nr:hypothetical protein [Clostridiales bacterium]
MFSKFKNNYRLSNILIRIALVLAYVLYTWHDILGNTQLVMQMYGSTLNIPYAYALVMAIFVSLAIGVAIMFIVPFVAGLFLNYSRIHNVPRAEFGLLANLFFTVYYVICGVFSLVNLYTPLLLTWGEKLVPFIVATGCVIGFYAVTKKLYFNNATALYYFRNLAIVYFVLAVLFGVVL